MAQVKRTLQQDNVAKIKNNGVYTIRAVAGSGKTFTMLEYMKEHPYESILYLVFNNSNRKEVQAKLKKSRINNVEVHTIHSFIYGKTITPMKKRKGDFYNDVGGAIEVGNGVSADDLVDNLGIQYRVALEVLKIYSKYLSSDLKSYDVIKKHITELNGGTFTSKDENKVNRIIEVFKWINKNSKIGAFEVSHDYYVKWYANKGNDIKAFDTVIVDEAQDVSGAMLQILYKFRCDKLILVGDSEQLIYSWRGAVNSLERVKKDIDNVTQLQLSNSFRVGKEIAKFSEYLTGNEVIGLGKNTFCDLDEIMKKDYYVVMSDINNSLVRFYIENFNSIKEKAIFFRNLELRNFWDILNFVNGDNDEITDMKLLKVASWNELLYILGLGDDDFITSKSYLEQVNKKIEDIGDYLSINYKEVVKVIKQYGATFVRICLSNLLNKRVKKESYPHDIMFTTVHTSKGSEYDNLIFIKTFYRNEKLKLAMLYSDSIEKFKEYIMDIRKTGSLDEIEELNTLYVAITRAKGNVAFVDNLNLREKIENGIFKITTKDM